VHVIFGFSSINIYRTETSFMVARSTSSSGKLQAGAATSAELTGIVVRVNGLTSRMHLEKYLNALSRRILISQINLLLS
jgi:uncharacterized protein involved in exopolysaccharide biosynthesis